MAKAQPLKKSLADEIVEQPFVKRGVQVWVDRLPADVQQDLYEVKKRFHERDGKYANATAQEVSKRIKAKLNLDLSVMTIRRWLSNYQ